MRTLGARTGVRQQQSAVSGRTRACAVEYRRLPPVRGNAKLGSVYAFRTELDAWTGSRRPAPIEELSDGIPGPAVGRRLWFWSTAAAATVLAVSFLTWRFQNGDNSVDNPVGATMNTLPPSSCCKLWLT